MPSSRSTMDQALLERMVDRFPYGAVVAFDRDLRYVRAGGQGFADGPLTPEDLLGRTLHEVWPEETAARLEGPYRAALEGEESEIEVPWEDRLYVVWTGPVGAGIPGGLSVTFDVTARQRTESELKLIQEAVGSLNVGLSIADARQEDVPLIYVNEGYSRVTGYGRGEAVGRNCRYLQGPDTDPEPVAAMRNAVREGRDVQVTLRNYRRDGTPFWNRVTITPIRNPEGAVTHFVGTQEDVSKQRELGEQLKVRERLSAVGQLAGGVAHDIRNVLTGVGGLLEVSLMRELEPELRTDLEEAKAVLERAASVTERLLVFSRGRSSNPEPLPLNQVLRERVDFLRKVVRESVAVDTDLCDGEVWVMADPGQLDQVLINLVKNAEDALPEGGTVRLCTVTGDEARAPFGSRSESGAAGSHVRLSVVDEGVGMDPETLRRAMEPFYTTKEGGQGTGLGLASVYGAVTQLGGQIRIDSVPGEGTRIHMLVPVTDRRPAGVAAPGVEAEHRPGRILVVEDEAAVRRMCEHALALDDHEVFSASDGRQGWDLYEREGGRFDLLLTDAIMPGISGVELMRRVAEQDPELPIILMTGYTDEDLEGDIDNERIHLLEKPFQLRQLRATVRRLLAGRVGPL